MRGFWPKRRSLEVGGEAKRPRGREWFSGRRFSSCGRPAPESEILPLGRGRGSRFSLFSPELARLLLTPDSKTGN